MIPDSYSHFRINPDSDSDVCRIAAKMWIHYLVGISYDTDCHASWPVTVGEMLVNQFFRSVGPITTPNFNEIV